MTARDVIVRCPGCGNGTVVPLAIGQRLRCDMCGTTFLVPLMDDGAAGASAPDGAWRMGRIAGSDSSPSEGTVEPTASWSGLVAATADLNAAKPGDAVTERGSTASPGSSFSGEEADAARTPHTGRSRPDEAELVDSGVGWWWTAVGMVAVGAILAAVIVLAFGFFHLGGDEHGAETVSTPSAGVAAGAGGSDSVTWSDASRASQRFNTITAKVRRVFYGSIRVKNTRQEVITTDDDNLLAVTVSVHNRGSRARTFRSWYAHAFADAQGHELLATLTDDQGRSYSLLKFDDVSYVEGQRLTDQVEPKQSVQDTVVFLIPEDVDRSTIAYFRLMLPAAAVGVADFFRFQIPVEMVEHFEEPEPEATNGDAQSEGGTAA